MSEGAKDSNDALHAVQSLTKMLVSQPCKSSKCSSQRFPYACKHGASCPFLAIGCCWFSHGDVQKSSSSNEDGKLQNSSPKRDAELAKLTESIEKKLSDLSRYVERCLEEVEAKIEDLAEAVFNQEGDTRKTTAAVESNKGGLQKLDAEEADKFKSLFAKLDKRMDEQLERYFAICLEKTQEVTGTVVEGAMQVSSKNIDARLLKIEARLARDAEDNG